MIIELLSSSSTALRPRAISSTSTSSSFIACRPVSRSPRPAPDDGLSSFSPTPSAGVEDSDSDLTETLDARWLAGAGGWRWEQVGSDVGSAIVGWVGRRAAVRPSAVGSSCMSSSEIIPSGMWDARRACRRICERHQRGDSTVGCRRGGGNVISEADRDALSSSFSLLLLLPPPPPTCSSLSPSAIPSPGRHLALFR